MKMATSEDEHNVSLYVGDLNSDVSEVNLMKLFGENKVSSCRVVRDNNTKKSLGYAYVNFNSHDDATKAYDRYNQSVCHGIPMRIMWAIKNPERRRDNKGNIFVKNIDKSVDSRTIYEAFKSFGAIMSFKICTDEFGHSLGYGFIHYNSVKEADEAIRCVNGVMFKGKAVQVSKFVPRKDRSTTKSPTYNNIFVKNFSEADKSVVESLFTKIGTVKSSCFKQCPHKDKMFAFFCYADAECAMRGVCELNGKELDSSTKLYVGKALKKNERAAELKRIREEWRTKMHNETKNRNLYVRNFPENWKDETLRDCFKEFGEITSCKVMFDESGRSKLFGFVCFKSEDEAREALEKRTGHKVGDKPLYVVKAQTKDERKYYMALQFNQLKVTNQGSQQRTQVSQMPTMQTQPIMANYGATLQMGMMRSSERGVYPPVAARGPARSMIYPPPSSVAGSSAQLPKMPPAFVQYASPMMSQMRMSMPHQKQDFSHVSQMSGGQMNYAKTQDRLRQIPDGSRQESLRDKVSSSLKITVPEAFIEVVREKLSGPKSFEHFSESELRNMYDHWNSLNSQK